jgi:hypothetical protein
MKLIRSSFRTTVPDDKSGAGDPESRTTTSSAVDAAGFRVRGLARDQAEWNPVSRPDHALNHKVRARSGAKPVSTFADRALVPAPRNDAEIGFGSTTILM